MIAKNNDLVIVTEYWNDGFGIEQIISYNCYGEVVRYEVGNSNTSKTGNRGVERVGGASFYGYASCRLPQNKENDK